MTQKTSTSRMMNKDELKASLDPSNLTKEDVEAFRDRYRSDPVLFCAEILGLELDDNQQNIANSLRDNKKTICVSARGCGKSVAISALAVWYFAMNPGAKVLMVANTAFQVTSVLWSKLSELISGSAISSWFDVSAEFVYWKGARDLGYITRLTASTDKVETVSGFHAPHLLYLIDESSAVPDKIILNLLSSMTEDDNRIILTSNPTRNTGFTAENCDSPSWNTLHISGFDSKWTNKDHLREMVEKYGEDSDICRVQVFGKFPKQSANILISSDQIEACLSVKGHPGDCVMGLDVAASGSDLSVWCIRIGGEVILFEEESSSTVESLTNRTLILCDRYKVDRIFIDATGLGWSIPQIISKNLPKTEVIGVNFSSKAPNMPQYYNERARMYGEMAKHMRSGEVSLSKVREKLGTLREELGATEQFLNNSGQFQLAPKENIRNLIGRSPDLTDSLALTFATEIPFTFAQSNSDMKRLDDGLFYAGLWR